MSKIHHVQNSLAGRFMLFNQQKWDDYTTLDTGDWTPALLEYRYMSDVPMYIHFTKWDQAMHFDAKDSNFFWSDAAGITSFHFNDGIKREWGEISDMLGLVVSNGNKLAKRLKEIVRVSRYHSSSPVKIYWEDYRGDKKHVDGKSVISRSYAHKLGLRKYHIHGNFRCITDMGLIKGDAIIISDQQMINTHGDLYDIVTDPINLKDEIATNGWTFSTFNPHHGHTQAMFDLQSASWLRTWLFPKQQLKDTLTTVIDSALDSLRNGEWPDWMVYAEDAHNDDFDLHMEQAGEAYKRHHLKWQMHDMKLEHSSALMGMAANSFKARLYSRLFHKNYRGEDNPLMWLPLPYAFYGHVVTHEFLVEYCGYEIDDDLNNKVFYHSESQCVSIPGDEFALTFEAHGTWDLDDSAKFLVRKCKDTGRNVVVIVRSPNSDGEYSIHEMDNIENFPLYHCYGEVPTIDIPNAPKSIEEVMRNQTIVGMPVNDRIADEIYTRAEAGYSYDVQCINPGIGQLANAMMVYYASTKCSPESVLATMGDMVDCVQQTPYMKGFKAIESFTVQLWNEIITHGTVDRYMANNRMPKMYRGAITKYDGYFQGLMDHFEQEARRFGETSKRIGFAVRAANPISEINALPSLDLDTARTWVQSFEKRYMDIINKHHGDDQYAKAFRVKLHRDLSRAMVNKLMDMDINTRNNLVISMYRYCTIPSTDRNFRFGRSDRCLFFPLTEGETTTMDIFINALISINVAREVN